MLVRAKPLTDWTQHPNCLRTWECKVGSGTYQILSTLSEPFVWGAEFNGVSLVPRIVESREKAIQVCQEHKQMAWLEDTEVPELAWEGNPEYTLYSGPYSVWKDPIDKRWRADFEVCDKGQPDEIIRGCKTEAEAKAACNAHNRTAILGGGNG